MSPGVPVLAAALVGVLGIVAVAQVGDGTPAAGVAVSTTTVAAAPLPTTAAPSSTAPTTDPTTPTTPPNSVDPAVTTIAPVTLPAGVAADGECPEGAHAAVIDRDRQRTWLCADGAPTVVMPISTAWSMPDPGDYPVYAKDLNATSNFGGGFSRMTHFVAFTYGKNTGARVAFHSVPTRTDGSYVQPLESVGDLGRRGESSGCIRVLPDDAIAIWDWLSIGDTVRVIS
jgi:hypothetical protein